MSNGITYKTYTGFWQLTDGHVVEFSFDACDFQAMEADLQQAYGDVKVEQFAWQDWLKFFDNIVGAALASPKGKAIERRARELRDETRMKDRATAI
jgi:hypothetical protein